MVILCMCRACVEIQTPGCSEPGVLISHSCRFVQLHLVPPPLVPGQCASAVTQFVAHPVRGTLPPLVPVPEGGDALVVALQCGIQ